MRIIGFISLLIVFFSFGGGAAAQTFDTILKWPYLYYYNWRETGVYYDDSVLCTVFEDADGYGGHDHLNYQNHRWINHNIQEYAVYQHTDVPLNVVGIAFSISGASGIWNLTLYDSAMNVIVRDTARGFSTNWASLFTDTATYKIFAVPGLDHSGYYEGYGVLPDEEMFLKMKYFSTPEDIEINGDFWIGISKYIPDSIASYNYIPSPYYIFEDHEPPYHITDVRFRMLDDGVWVDDTIEGAIPELLALIEPVCHTVTGLTAVMDSMGNVDISWDSADNQTKWVVHFTGPGVMETDTVTSCHKHYGGLYPNQAYSVKVNARCYQSKYNIWSGWSETIWVGNTTGSIAEAEAFSFTMKPNPAKDKVTIAAEGYDGTATVSIATVGGMEVLRCEKAALPLTLDLAGLASGIYMVRVGTPTGTATKRLAVQ